MSNGAPFGGVFSGQTILVTGHTGFKGSWLTAWLLKLGARVIGFSLDTPPTEPSNFVACNLGERIADIRGDICDYASLERVIVEYRPALVFHLAAQPVVLRSVSQPLATMAVNVMGTINLLDAVRKTDCVRAVVCATTDKVYSNHEWCWGYRETDSLGGHDPYSASKAMAELAVDAYRSTYFARSASRPPGPAVATVRAGNVIGGGDFAEYRLVPDCMRALMAGRPIEVRNPRSVRPWQFVLEPLSGYLCLASRLLSDGQAYAEAWNFGPRESRGVTAEEMVARILALWGSGNWVRQGTDHPKVETGYLRLSWEKAGTRLGWEPVYTLHRALVQVVEWFQEFVKLQAGHPSVSMHSIVGRQIAAYEECAREVEVPWICQ